MAGRKPDPTALASLKGADKHDPQRYKARAKEPKPVLGIGSCPAWLDVDAIVVWAEIESEMAAGVLTRQDRQQFAVLCSLLAEFRAAPREMNGAKLSTINSLAAQFGMTPSSRTKVATIGQGDEDRENTFAEFSGLRAVK